MRPSTAPLLLGFGLSVPLLVGGCAGDDAASSGTTTSPSSTSASTGATETDGSSTATESSSSGNAETEVQSASPTTNGGTMGGCFPDQSPCGGDCCDPNEACMDGVCTTRTTMSTGTDSTGSTTDGTTSTTDSTTDSTTTDGTTTDGTGTTDATSSGTDSTGTTGGVDPACALMYDTGPCDGAFIRYWYNPKTMQCEEFSWGGCQGVVPFEDLASCQMACE